jgi:ribosomal protein S18 acetylase RimI-like enzyme
MESMDTALARHRDVAIRLATELDRNALYEICLHTGDAGRDASELLRDGSLYGHVYAGQYLSLAPDFALVAERDGAVVGYVLGALDSAAFEARCELEWWPPLRALHPLPGDGTDLDRVLTGLIHHPYRTDERLLARYPSHLHINLLPSAHGCGLGRLLMATLMHRLAEAGSTGVHLGVDPRNDHAIGFYEHLGFTRHDPDGAVLFTHRLVGLGT